MGRNNQNSKFKAWQSPEPKQSIEGIKISTNKAVNEPLKVVEPEVKPQLKKGKKVEE